MNQLDSHHGDTSPLTPLFIQTLLLPFPLLAAATMRKCVYIRETLYERERVRGKNMRGRSQKEKERGTREREGEGECMCIKADVRIYL